jgi:predicted glycoside hydrolase/deacetylase ChbG (UPF0249 family)
VNTAIAKVAATGIPFSVQVMFACPWYQEAVEILKKYPHVTVGVHLTLNSEWSSYRWGPVLGKTGAPSLVDGNGYFLPSRAEFLARKVDLGEVERELSAQMDRAMASGLKITTADMHMGTAAATPALREVLERVAKKYNVGISTYFGESYFTMWGVPVADKKARFLEHLSSAKPGITNLVEVHVAERSPEMEVIFDQNAPSQNGPDGKPLVVAHRQAELDMLLAPEFAAMVRAGKVKLITYEQLIARAGGPSAMRRPSSAR